MRKMSASLLAAAILLAGCSSQNAPQPAASTPAAAASAGMAAPATSSAATASTDQAAVRAVVQRFGKQMQKISVLAPPDAVRRELPKVYAGLISPELFDQWKAHPDQIVGREGSSPWPQKIVIANVACATRNACKVTGKVDYITSNEVEHGGVFMRRAITLDMTRTAQGWRIASVQLAPATQ